MSHDPLLSSYRLKLRKIENIKIQNFVYRNVKKSHFKNYPNRIPLIETDIHLSIKIENQIIKVPINNKCPLLNRVRTRHTRARVHLKNIGIEKESTCRHCKRHPETIEHQQIKCKTLKKRLKMFRDEYRKVEISNWTNHYAHTTHL